MEAHVQLERLQVWEGHIVDSMGGWMVPLANIGSAPFLNHNFDQDAQTHHQLVVMISDSLSQLTEGECPCAVHEDGTICCKWLTFLCNLWNSVLVSPKIRC